MNRRTAILMLLLSAQTFAQTVQPSPLDSIKVVGVQLVPQEKLAKVEVQNVSKQEITGFGIDLLWRYTNGEEKPDGLVTDLALGQGFNSVPGGPRMLGVSFLPGESRTLLFSNFTASDGSPAVSASAHPAMVAFEDRTAGGDPRQIQTLVNGRRDLSSKLNELLTRIRVRNGHPTQMSWTAQGANVGFLSLDRNGNGKIDNGTELFGNLTAQAASKKPNGFRALAVFDLPANGGNHDGWITSKDTVFSKLLMWVDKNHNGVSEPNELLNMQQANMRAISLAYSPSIWVDAYGNESRYRGEVVWQKDVNGQPTAKIYDVLPQSASQGGGTK